MLRVPVQHPRRTKLQISSVRGTESAPPCALGPLRTCTRPRVAVGCGLRYRPALERTHFFAARVLLRELFGRARCASLRLRAGGADAPRLYSGISGTPAPTREGINPSVSKSSMRTRRLRRTSRSTDCHAIAMEGETHAAILDLARTDVRHAAGIQRFFVRRLCNGAGR